MRSDLVIDGFARGRLRVAGSDATTSTIALFKKLKRNDINAIMISGSVLSLYNVLDIDSIYEDLRVPTVALSFSKARSDLARNITARFPDRIAKEKISLLNKLGGSKRLKLRTGYAVFVRTAGVTEVNSKRLLDRFTLQGAIPEPVRVAKLVAKCVATSAN